MVGNTMFNVEINNRLKDIKGSSLPFRGVSIIAIGDLFQLQPVTDGRMVMYLKDMDNSGYGILAPNLWQEHFSMFRLHEIMRQRESKDFAEVLNRLGEGNHTTEDIMKFKERMIEPTVVTTPKMFFTCLYRMQRSLSSMIEHKVPYQVLSTVSKQNSVS